MSGDKNFYLPSLDGFRMLAATLVFIAHAGWGHFVPGGLGVTIFFFLSGYLITTLLRREYEKNNSINLRNFYLRRFYRIFPPMYFVLFCIFVLGKLGLVPDTSTVSGFISQLLQFSNYHIIYSDDPGVVFSTGIFWSLSVEEHFYLIFPLLLIYFLRKFSFAQSAKILIILCIAELIWRCYLVLILNVSHDRTYLATDTRFDSLLYGCILGLWMNPVLDLRSFNIGEIQRLMLFSSATVLLVFSVVFRNEIFRETLRYSMQGIALFPIFLLAVRYPGWWPFQWLNWRPIKYLGVLSYSFYLTHVFWLELVKPLSYGKIPTAIIAFFMSVVSAHIIRKTIEIPFINLRKKLHE